MRKTALVVPTNRPDNCLEFLSSWSGVGFDHIIIVEDNPTITFLSSADQHVSWKEIEEDLGENSWVISRRDSAIRSYGFLLAHRLGAEYIFTLDDDCFPIGDNDFVRDHVANIESTKHWTESIPGQRTRGLPYFNLGTMKNIMFSIGLWEGIPDFDSVQTLNKAFLNTELPESRVMPAGQYFPFCGMNFCFKREVAPLCYFPLQGEGHPFRRFDDIWFGVIAKKICDHLRYGIVLGKPCINHTRASQPMVNLVKEAPGIAFNEEFWTHIDQIPLSSKTPSDCMAEIGQALEHNKNDYLGLVGKALKIWAGLFHSPSV